MSNLYRFPYLAVVIFPILILFCIPGCSTDDPTQPAPSSILSVTPTNRDVSSSAGSTSFSVSNSGGGTMSWSATDNSSWVTLTGASGTNSGPITASFTANSGGSSRVCTITVTASGATGNPKQVTITQEAPALCLLVSPVNRDVPSSAGSTTFNVVNECGGTMNWTATESCSWVTLSPTSGTNNGTITATYTANGGGSSRVCTITVTAPGATGSPEQVTVTQAAPDVHPLLNEIVEVLIDDDTSGASNGNADGFVHVGETIELEIRVRNNGTAAAENVSATLDISSGDATCCTITDDDNTYPNISAGSTEWNNGDFDFEVTCMPPGEDLDFTLVLNYGGGSSPPYSSSIDFEIDVYPWDITLEIPPAIDGEVSSYWPDESHPSNEWIRVYRAYGDFSLGLFNFPGVAAIPSGAEIIEARLRFYAQSYNGSKNLRIATFRSPPWSESITLNGWMDLNWTLIDYTEVGYGDFDLQTIYIDITDLIRNSIGYSDFATGGIRLSLTNTTESGESVDVNSSEHATSSRQPRLFITYRE